MDIGKIFKKNRIVENSLYFQLKEILDNLECPINPMFAIIKLKDVLQIGMESINKINDTTYQVLFENIIVTITLDLRNQEYILGNNFDVVNDTEKNNIEVIESY